MKNVALITGASAGLGKDFADIHAKNKGDLVLIARREEKLNEIKKELESKYGVQVMVIAKDLSIYESAVDIYHELKEKSVEVKYLINNAGFGGIGKFSEREWESDKQMINLNIMALTHLSRLFINDFIERNEGRILNVSSTAALVPGPFQAVYYATKAFVTSFSNAINEELKGSNVSVTALMPGATATEFGEVSGMDKTAMFKYADKSYDVALKGYKAMMKGKLNIITMPFLMKMMMKMTALLPKSMVLSTIRKMQDVK